jgi:microcystin-dependent protein
MADGFLGEIRMFSGNYAPSGWAPCEGQIMPIAQNAALFSIVGTTYGGDGRVAFALPDLRGRGPIFWGEGPNFASYVIGQQGGVEAVTLTNAEMPAHTHQVTATNAPGQSESPSNTVPSTVEPSGTNVYGPPAQEAVGMHEAMIAPSGGGQAVYTRSPFLAVTFIINIAGPFPPQ